jgi:hypothetical protein
VCLQTNLHQNHQFQLKHQPIIFLHLIVLKTNKHRCLELPTLINQRKLPFLVMHHKHFYSEATRLIKRMLRKQMKSHHSSLVILHLKHLCLEHQHQVCLLKVQLPPRKLPCLDNLIQGQFSELQEVFSVLLQRHLFSVSQQVLPRFLGFRKIISQVYLISQLCLISKSLRMMMMRMMVRLKQIKKHLFMQKVAMIKLCLSKGYRLKNHLTRKCLM